jgi:hypothetical protein
MGNIFFESYSNVKKRIVDFFKPAAIASYKGAGSSAWISKGQSGLQIQNASLNAIRARD